MPNLEIPFPEAIVFDWDNTLVDTWPLITDALNKVRALHNLETWTVDEARIKSSRSLRDSFPEWFGADWTRMRDLFYEHVDQQHLAKLERVAGAQELLEWLSEQGIPAYIVSTKRSDLLIKEVDHLGWKKFFVCIVGSGDVAKDKPNRMAMDHALIKGGLKADNPAVWYVGDSQSDVELALNSGCMPVMMCNVPYGKKIGVKLNFSDCFELKTALNKWN